MSQHEEIIDVMRQRQDLLEALEDMLSGWRYIRETYGDLNGVGWDRCEGSARAAITKAKGPSND